MGRARFSMVPLMVEAEVEIQRPLSRDELSAVFSDFAFTTEVAIGEAIRGLEHAEEETEGRSVAAHGERRARPVGSKNSCGRSVIEFEEAAETFAGMDLTG